MVVPHTFLANAIVESNLSTMGR